MGSAIDPTKPNSPNALTESLARVRQRLLDLSLRNQLLNYRFPARGSVRFVDEHIDFVYAQLRSDEALALEPPHVELRR